MRLFDFHLSNLQRIAASIHRLSYAEAIDLINALYFSKSIFDDILYAKADQFIFQQDVTALSYGHALKLGYEALLREDSEVLLLSLKVVIVKLLGNQRLAYFDRDEIRALLNEMSAQSGLSDIAPAPRALPDFVIRRCGDYMPIGFFGEGIEPYR